MSDLILQFDRITKRFPGVLALDGVSFAVARGECHALCGENGAGKSTLGRIVAGIYRPDGGRLLLDGHEVRFDAPQAAARAGVAMVHQELALCPNLSVGENLCLADMPAARGVVNWRELHARAAVLLEAVGLPLDPRTPAGALSAAQRQLVQIALAVGREAGIIVMDEPTSSLSQSEAERLFGLIAGLRQRGITIVYVSHRMEEILRLCDRITVLRDGRYIRTLAARDTSVDEIVQLMIGRPVAEYFPQAAPPEAGPPLLEVRGLCAGARVRDVSFEVRAGEIVGLAGLVGSGRSEVARAIFGIDRPDAGMIVVAGHVVDIRSPADAIGHGIGLVPEDRQRQGLVLPMSCKENVSLSLLERLKRRILIDAGRERGLARRYVEQLRVRAPDVDAAVAGLSGGNQQKIALAKWLARECRVLILDEPTRGVDIGAKAEIHALVGRLASQGHAIVLISSELPELLHLCTRILVMADGRLVGEVPRSEATQERLMRLMARVAAA